MLATDNARPKTSDAPRLQRQNVEVAAPSAVATAICRMAPGMAIRRTAIRSASEKCNPTPSISSITPISANWAARSASATYPGVKGPIRMPANR